MSEQAETPTLSFETPTLEDMQHWTGVIGRAQQLMMEFTSKQMQRAGEGGGEKMAMFQPGNLSGSLGAMPNWSIDPSRLAQQQADFWQQSINLWSRFLGQGPASESEEGGKLDRRFAAPQWQDHPLFDLIRRAYLLLAEQMMTSVDTIEGIEPKQREQLRFITRQMADAMSPSNFAITNPQAIERAIETRGESMLKGLEHMLSDLSKGQLTHVDTSAFTLGENIATTPGKVIRETPLYQLIQYEPTTKQVHEIPLIIFPPWINRFYILDLNEKKSFVRWAVEQGFTVFMVSWKSADKSLADVTQDDYVLRGQLDAIDTVRDLLGVESVNVIGYCVAGTTLAMTLAYLAAQGEADKVESATFFTAQVDFSEAGDLQLFIDDMMGGLIEKLSTESGFLDGRYMSATFNLLRERDLIWNYVVNNYLLGEDYPAFDLLYWNGDTSNLPAKWHKSYLRDFYRENKLIEPGALNVDGVPIDLKTVKTPSYIQAGREDHIAPAESVWKMTDHFAGPMRFVLAGSGHIAGVVNPPSSGKYQYWINEKSADSLEAFVAGAKEISGSWWPDWRDWLADRSGEKIPVKGARKPGKGDLAAIEDAPGSYVSQG